MDKETSTTLSTRDRILSATLNIIGREGFQSVTVRKIASIADVNISAVSYYFGSKDNVINEALKFLTDRFVISFNCLDDTSLSPRERLRNFLRSYSDTALAYPDVFRNLISQSILNYDLPPAYVEFLRQEGFEKLKAVITEEKEIKDDSQLFMKIFQTISGVAFPVLLGRHMNRFSCIDYEDKNVRYQYVEELLKSILSE